MREKGYKRITVIVRREDKEFIQHLAEMSRQMEPEQFKQLLADIDAEGSAGEARTERSEGAPRRRGSPDREKRP